jgi:predicted  nucleic acid-binding Zn-ribbon protein
MSVSNGAKPLALSGNRLYNLIMSQPFKLYRLQQIDSQIDQTKSRLQETEIALSDNSEVQGAKSAKSEMDLALLKAQKALRVAEEEVKAVQLKLEQTESTLYGGKVRNPKELQDLQKENAALKRQINALEDHQLDVMLAVEEAENKHQQSVSFLDETQKKDSVQKSKLAEFKTNLINELERLESERQATASTISADDLLIYDQIRKQKRGVAVSKITDNACSSCGSTLTPSQIQAASSPNQLSRCSFCGRILYTG